jgi:hypothetical protein
MEIVYQCDTYNKSARDAAVDFARTYFDKPRDIVVISEGFGIFEFRLKNGVALYFVHYIPAVKNVSAAWIIKRL